MASFWLHLADLEGYGLCLHAAATYQAPVFSNTSAALRAGVPPRLLVIRHNGTQSCWDVLQRLGALVAEARAAGAGPPQVLPPGAGILTRDGGTPGAVMALLSLCDLRHRAVALWVT